jgi:hypothetical protein
MGYVGTTFNPLPSLNVPHPLATLLMYWHRKVPLSPYGEFGMTRSLLFAVV